MINTKYTEADQKISVADNVKLFKKGKCKILLATNVIEEGFDVSNCNVVIVYNAITTEKSFIQLKGRAREASSKFLIFSNKNYKEIYEEKIDTFMDNYSQLKNLGLDPREVNAEITEISNLQKNLIPDYQKFRIGIMNLFNKKRSNRGFTYLGKQPTSIIRLQR